MLAQSTPSRSTITLATLGSVARLLTLDAGRLYHWPYKRFLLRLRLLGHARARALPDHQYVEAMRAINATVRNGVFAFSFFGAVLSLLLALAIHAPQLRSRRFVLIALAAVLYMGVASW